MKLSKTQKAIRNAIAILNRHNGKVYPEIGYILKLDIRGDGNGFRPGVYVIINSAGGVTVSQYQGATPAETKARLDSEIMRRIQDESRIVYYRAGSENRRFPPIL